MRLIIAHYLPDLVSGAELAIADMVDRMDHRIEVTMLTPGPGLLADTYRQRGFRVWERMIDTPRRRYPGLHTLESFFLSRQLQRLRAGLVLSNTFAAAGRVGDAARMAGIPHVIYVREYFSDRPAHRKMLDRANGILAVSRDTRSHFESWTDTQKICLAYDAVNPAPILERVAASQASGMRRLPFGPDHRVVGWVGRITPYKQPDLFIRAIPKLLSRFPEMRFVVVGSASERDRRYADSLHELASGLGLGERLGWMGNRPDAVEIMAELDCLCVTSTREPFPRVILEAQVCGCPLVASATGGCAEMVADGSTGILFDPMGPAAADNLAACLTSLFENPGYRERLSTQARQAVLNGLAGPEPVLRLEKILLDFGKRDERHG